MRSVVYSGSSSFQAFLQQHLDVPIEFRNSLGAPYINPRQVHLVHVSSLADNCYQWLDQHVLGKTVSVAVCSNLPNVQEMLKCVQLGARGYCNSYMVALHYHHMLGMLANEQSWFPPGLLDETFKLAQQVTGTAPRQKQIESLTSRENEVAGYVAEGMSNRQIADLLGISTVTVKTHLTRIFKKLELKDRVGLVLHLKQA
jgi:DNA-binding NarL/FixJ family response regulator